MYTCTFVLTCILSIVVPLSEWSLCCLQKPVVQEANSTRFSNSKIEWVLLPSGEVFPEITKVLLEEFSEIEELQLGQLKKDPDSFAFAYVASAYNSGRIQKLPRFNIEQGPMYVKSAFGALTVNIRFAWQDGRLTKKTKYSRPFKNSGPCLGGVLAFSRDVHTSSFASRLKQAESEIGVEGDKTGAEDLLHVKPLVHEANMTNFYLVFEAKTRKRILSYGISAIQHEGIDDSVLPVVHVALSNYLLGGRRQVSFHKKGVTIVHNGLTVLAEYDFDVREWVVTYPKLDSEKAGIKRQWQLMSENTGKKE